MKDSRLLDTIVSPGDLVTAAPHLPARAQPIMRRTDNEAGWTFGRLVGVCVAAREVPHPHAYRYTWACVLVGDRLGWFYSGSLWKVVSR